MHWALQENHFHLLAESEVEKGFNFATWVFPSRKVILVHIAMFLSTKSLRQSYMFRFGNIEGLKGCLEGGADVNAIETRTGNTTLHYACQNNQENAVRYLLEQGADSCIRNRFGKNTADVCKECRFPHLESLILSQNWWKAMMGDLFSLGIFLVASKIVSILNRLDLSFVFLPRQPCRNNTRTGTHHRCLPRGRHRSALLVNSRSWLMVN